jgi:hypothetical protein
LVGGPGTVREGKNDFKGLNMWPFSKQQDRAVVVFHIDQNGLAKGAFFRGQADVLIIDERDPRNRVYRMSQETPSDELRRKIGKHPLNRLLDPARMERNKQERPALSLHWRTDNEAVV